MSKVPFFSILLPTKNRSHIVGYAIQSVLNQTWQDFELIVVDNDDTDATSQVACSFSDERIRYFRTGDLNMCENWQFALAQAGGKYVTVLEDKQAYYPDALEILQKTISETNVEVVAWHWDIYNDNIKLAYKTTSQSGAEIVSSEQVLQEYVNLSPEVWTKLPRTINSCASMELIKRVERHPNIDSFFAYLSPDLCAAFYSLAMVDKLCILKQSLGLVGYFQLSNAFQSLKKSSGPFDFFGKGNYQSVVVDSVPIKETRLLHNSIYNDFLRSRKKLGGRLASYEMTPRTYARMCMMDLARMRGDISSIRREIMDYMKSNHISPWPLRLLYMRLWIIRKLGQLVWLSELRDQFKPVKWASQNILQATRRGA